MSYKNIEKISNEIYRPSRNFILKHNVKVAHKNREGRRELFHSEYSYSSSQYIDKKYLKMIKLNYLSFLTLEETGKDWTEREVVMITTNNIHLFKKTMKKVKKWFYKEKYTNLYYYDEHKILKTSLEFKDLKAVIQASNNTIVFTPTVIEIDGVYYEGVRMYVNTVDSLCEMTIDKFEALYNIIKNFDLYLAGMELINYLSRPEFDTNNFVADDKFFKKETSFVESKGNLNKDIIDKPLKGFFK